VTSTRLVLVRHGQHDYTVEDGPLTDLGCRQARLVASALPGRDIDVLLCSPLRRAVETAQRFGRAFEPVDGLREFDFGPAAPAAEAMVERREDLALWRPDDGFADGETLAGFQARVGATMDELTRAHDGAGVVAVTHAGFLDAALRWAYGIGPAEAWVTEAAFRNASITELEVWTTGRHPRGAPRHTVIHRVGDASHLPRELWTDL
jgi:probable phosphoglycerate mutase